MAVVLDAATFRPGGSLRKLDGSSIGTPAMEEGVPIRNGTAIVNASAPGEGYMMLPRLLVTYRGTEKAVLFTPPVTFRVTEENLQKGRIRIELGLASWSTCKSWMAAARPCRMASSRSTAAEWKNPAP